MDFYANKLSFFFFFFFGSSNDKLIIPKSSNDLNDLAVIFLHFFVPINYCRLKIFFVTLYILATNLYCTIYFHIRYFQRDRVNFSEYFFLFSGGGCAI